MSKKMAENKKNTPALRFPEFKGAWEYTNLGDIADFSKGRGISKTDIDDNASLECIRYGELYTYYEETIRVVKSRTNLNPADLVLSDANDVIIPASGESQIDIAKASCVLKSGIALGSDLNIIRTKHNGVFLSYYLNSAKKFDIANLAQGISVVHLYSSQLKLLNLNLPKEPEQKKIADFFTTVDQKISQLNEKKSLLEQYKKGVMQSLFTQRLRFLDNNGNSFPDWEEKKMSECFYERSERDNPNLNLLSVTLSEGIVKRADIDAKDNSSSDKSNYKKVTPNDIAYNSMRMWQGASGVSAYEGIVSPAYTVLKPHDSILSRYFGYFFKYGPTIKIFEKHSQGLTSDTWNLKYSKFSQIKFFVPSKAEQQIITNFLTTIDTKITTLGNQLTAAHDFKKALLQKMFV